MTALTTMTTVEIMSTYLPGSSEQPWTWADEERDLLSRECLCCGHPGHYQLALEEFLRGLGRIPDSFSRGGSANEEPEYEGHPTGPVLLGSDGRVWDGHHRIVAAHRLGFADVGPVEVVPRKPSRVQRRRTKGWRMPEGAVYVGRPTKWGNPFVVYAHLSTPVWAPGPTEPDIVRDSAHAVELYRRWIDNDGRLGSYVGPRTGFGPVGRFTAPLGSLRGRDLVCWCPLDQACHADVLLELANREAS